MFMADWHELAVIVEAMELDVRKHIARNNRAAGLRMRHALRTIKTRAHDLLLRSLERDKQEIERRRTLRTERNANKGKT